MVDFVFVILNFPGGTLVKNPPARGEAGEAASIPGLGRSPGVGNGNLLPGKFRGQMSLVGYSPLGHKESDTTELTYTVLVLILP